MQEPSFHAKQAHLQRKPLGHGSISSSFKAFVELFQISTLSSTQTPLGLGTLRSKPLPAPMCQDWHHSPRAGQGAPFTCPLIFRGNAEQHPRPRGGPGRSWERAGPHLSSGLLRRCLAADTGCLLSFCGTKPVGHKGCPTSCPDPGRTVQDGSWCGRGPPQDQPFSHQPPVVASVTRGDRVGLAVLATRVATPKV